MENCNKTIKPSEKLTVPAKIDIKSKIIPINIINKRILLFCLSGTYSFFSKTSQAMNSGKITNVIKKDFLYPHQN